MQLKDILLSTKAEKFLSECLANVFGWLLADKQNKASAQKLAESCNVNRFKWQDDEGFADISVICKNYYFIIKQKGSKWQMSVFADHTNKLIQAYGEEL